MQQVYRGKKIFFCFLQVDRGEELSISSIFGSAKVSQESDNILLIQDNRLTKPGGKKYLQVVFHTIFHLTQS